MATLQNLNVEEIRRLVNEHNDAVLKLLQDFVNRNMSEFNTVQVYQRSDGFGWQVSATLDRNSSPSSLFWLAVYVKHDRSYVHIHMNPHMGQVGGGPFRELAHAVYGVINIPVYVYPPKLYGRWNVIREGVEADEEHHVETSIALIGASLGISTVAMTQLLGRSDYTLVLYFALGCFAVSIPLLTVVVFMLFSSKIFRSMVLLKLRLIVSLIGNIATLFGVVFLFFYYHWFIGMTFVIFTIIAFTVLVVYTQGLLLLQEFWVEVSAPDNEAPVDASKASTSTSDKTGLVPPTSHH